MFRFIINNNISPVPVYIISIQRSTYTRAIVY